MKRLHVKILDSVYEKLEAYQKAYGFSSVKDALTDIIEKTKIPLEIPRKPRIDEWQKEICKHIIDIDLVTNHVQCKKLNKWITSIDCQRCSFKET